MKKIFIKSHCSLFIIILAFCALSFSSMAEGECNHNFVDGICECGTYCVDVGKTVRVSLSEKGERIYPVAWTVYENSPILVETKGSEGHFDQTEYYAVVKGLKAGESYVLAYSGGSLVQRIKVIVECKDHSFEEYISDNNASCLDGTKTAKCEFCEVTDTVTDIGSAVHNVKYTSNNDATCTLDGTKSGVCSECGRTVTVIDENSKLPHDYRNYASDNNAGCIENGTKTGICTGCGDRDTVTEENSALGHSFGEYTADRKATCEGDATVTAKCIRCSKTDTKTEPGTSLGHKYTSFRAEKETTCTEDGLYVSECLRCGDRREKVEEKTGHNYILQKPIDPTCVEEGRTRGMYCSNCNQIFVESQSLPKTDHTIDLSVDPATPDKNGFTSETCRYCNKTFSFETVYRPKTIMLQQSSYVYSGSVITPTVIVEDVNGKALTEGTDYTLSYNKSLKAVGKHIIKVEFKGKYKDSKDLELTVHPSKSEKIEATQTTDTITLTWSAVKGATGYRLYKYNSKTKKYETVKTLTSKTYTIKKLKAGTTYKYAVKAYTKTADGETIWAKESAKITTATKPATLKVKLTAGSKKVDISWNKVSGATGYQVYMKAPGESYKKIKVTTDNKYTVKKLKKGATYKFRVRAYSKIDGKYIYGEYKTYSVTVK